MLGDDGPKENAFCERSMEEVFDAEKRENEAVPSPAKSPNTQAYVEWFIGSIRSECLETCVFLGTEHLDGVMQTWLEHYHAERPNQRVGNEQLVRRITLTKLAPRDEGGALPRVMRCRKA